MAAREARFLLAALDIGDFSLDELAATAMIDNVSANTFMARYKYMFIEVGSSIASSVSPEKRRWRIDGNKIDKMKAIISGLLEALNYPTKREIDDTSLLAAEGLLVALKGKLNDFKKFDNNYSYECYRLWCLAIGDFLAFLLYIIDKRDVGRNISDILINRAKDFVVGARYIRRSVYEVALLTREPTQYDVSLVDDKFWDKATKTLDSFLEIKNEWNKLYKVNELNIAGIVAITSPNLLPREPRVGDPPKQIPDYINNQIKEFAETIRECLPRCPVGFYLYTNKRSYVNKSADPLQTTDNLSTPSYYQSNKILRAIEYAADRGHINLEADVIEEIKLLSPLTQYIYLCQVDLPWLNNVFLELEPSTKLNKLKINSSVGGYIENDDMIAAYIKNKCYKIVDNKFYNIPITSAFTAG
jgi:hypothetical protein